MSQAYYTTLWSHLASIPDPRGRRGQQYEWTYLLTLLAAALLAGQQSIQAMSAWVSGNGPVLVEALKPRRQRIPSYATRRRALCAVEIEALEHHLALFTQSLSAEDASCGRIETLTGEVLYGQSIDGKTLRGASAHGEKVHLVSVVRHESGVVLAQTTTEAGIDEPKAAKALLPELSLVNPVTTMDALYTERPLAEQIVAAGGEDRCQVRSGSAPQALAALRNAIVSALRHAGWAHLPNALRRFALSPLKTLQFLGVPAT